MTYVRPSVRWLRDQIKAALLEHPRSTTAEICKAICAECRTTTVYHHYSRVYASLRTMDAAQEVIWHPWHESSKATVWELVDRPADDLEAAWQLDSTGGT